MARTLLAASVQAAWRRKSLTIAGLVVATAVSCVSWNALVGQARPHPYPMFGGNPPPAPQVSATAPLPIARPRELAAAETKAPARAVASDPIGDLIRAPETGSIKAAEPQKSLAEAQRSLARLGYGPIKSDGVMGQGTRTALERFERDNKLPVTGALGPRTGRALAAKTRDASD